MDSADPIKPGQGITEAETSAHPNLRDSQVNHYLSKVHFGERSLQMEKMWFSMLTWVPVGLEWHGASINLLDVELFQHPQKFPCPDQVPNSHLKQSPCWTCTQGNTSGFIWEMFLLGLMALPGDWLFCFGLIHPQEAVGSKRAAPGLGHCSELYGHRNRACRYTGGWALCHLLQSHHKAGAEKADGWQYPC